MTIEPLLSLVRQFLIGTANKMLWLKFTSERIFSQKEFYRFRCNICGATSVSPLSAVRDREARSCCVCGSNRRFRSIAAVLSVEISGGIKPLPELKISRDIKGIGLSDSLVYANTLSKLFSYENTYYHKHPRLDITSVPEAKHNTADFIIASDVFEHVPPPIGKAFDNLFKMLKRGGVCIFSVPYANTGETVEHFPDLFEYEIIKKNGKRLLVNKTQQGKEQFFENLCFHGGPGSTLEMRRFSMPSLLQNMQRSGFIDIRIHGNSYPEFGILEEGDGSQIISIRKP